MKGTEGGFGLFEEGIIASTLDHVQRPAVPRARTLGHTEPRLEVMTAPDQGRRHFDPPEDIPRDGTHSVLRHQTAESGLRRLRARPLKGVRAKGFKALGHLEASRVNGPTKTESSTRSSPA